MHKKLFPKPAIEAKHRGGLVGAHFDCFVSWMQEHGYSRETMRYHIQRVTHFGTYLEQRDIRSIHELEGEGGVKILAAYQQYWKTKGHWGRNHGLGLYIRALKDAGIIRRLASNRCPLFPDTEQYICFLKSQKGLSKSTINYHI